MHVHVHTREKWHPEVFPSPPASPRCSTSAANSPISRPTARRSSRGPGPGRGFSSPVPCWRKARRTRVRGFCRRFDAARTEAAVDALADAGVDGIKLYVTVRPTPRVARASRAHARGLPVFMHQHATWGAEAALAGVDSVEHVNVFGQLAPQGFWLAEPRSSIRSSTVAGSGGGSRSRSALRRGPPPLHGLIAAGTAARPDARPLRRAPGASATTSATRSMDDPERSKLLPLLPAAVGKELVGRWAPSAAGRGPRRLGACEASDAARVGQHSGTRRRLPSCGWDGAAGTDCPTSPSSRASRCIESSSC